MNEIESRVTIFPEETQLSHLWKTNKMCRKAERLLARDSSGYFRDPLMSSPPKISKSSTCLNSPPAPVIPLPLTAFVSVAGAENFYALVNKSVKFNADEQKFTTLQIKLDFYLNKLHFMRWRRPGTAPSPHSLPCRNNKQATAIICTGI